MSFEVGDKVRITDFHIERLVGRTGTVTRLRVGPSRKYIKVKVPGFENSLGTESWYLAKDEMEKV